VSGFKEPEGSRANESRPPVQRPSWVLLAVWGLPTRASVWAFVWLSLALAIGCVVYGFWNPIFFFGALLVFSALWYYAAIRWIDRNDRWV
jgi:hypothetical protein